MLLSERTWMAVAIGACFYSGHAIHFVCYKWYKDGSLYKLFVLSGPCQMISILGRPINIDRMCSVSKASNVLTHTTHMRLSLQLFTWFFLPYIDVESGIGLDSCFIFLIYLRNPKSEVCCLWQMWQAEEVDSEHQQIDHTAWCYTLPDRLGGEVTFLFYFFIMRVRKRNKL